MKVKIKEKIHTHTHTHNFGKHVILLTILCKQKYISKVKSCEVVCVKERRAGGLGRGV